MTNFEKLQDFYINGNDPEFEPIPNQSFVKNISAELVPFIPGHFYTHIELFPIGPDDVPTWDEYEILKNPSTRDLQRSVKYKINKPYYDNRPIYLALDSNGLGLNIKLMSQGLRKSFIMMYLRVMKNAISNCYNDGELSDLRTRLRDGKIMPFLSINYEIIKRMIGMPDFKLGILVNKYNREKIRNLTLIDWDDVSKLPLVNYSTDRTISSRSSFSLYEIT